MKELTRRYEVDITLLFYQFGSSMWQVLGSVFPKDSYRRLDLQLVTQLIDDWIIRGFVHRWVCMNRTFRGGAPLKELDHWKPAYEGCLLSLVARLFLDPCILDLVRWVSSPLPFLHVLAAGPEQQSQLSVADISDTPKPPAKVNPLSHRLLVSRVLLQWLELSNQWETRCGSPRSSELQLLLQPACGKLRTCGSIKRMSRV